MSTSFETWEKPVAPNGSQVTMRASVLCGVERMEVRDVPLPDASAHDVVVRVSAVG
ncbi:MAG TPA: hypothetical protein VHQ95_11805 [Pyrinomonadaceae bacterium]|nr:hypothetical protein [Pyrinomonadaceae bacterium]